MNRLAFSAKAYIALVVIVGGCLIALVPGDRTLPTDSSGLITLGVTMLLAAGFQVRKVEGATAKTSYNLGLAIFGFTLVVLGPASVIIVAVFAAVIEWIWHRYPWYIQTFNIFCLTIDLTAAWMVYDWFVDRGGSTVGGGEVLGVVVSTLCFVLLNHLMVGLAVSLARREPFSRSGVLSRMSLLIDGTLFATGAVAALLWLVYPYASLLMVIPLYMLSVTVRVPSLEGQASRDAKTGLFNARYFQQVLTKELERANRFDRPLTVVMADLDLLRNINNTYGHLAGDAVLTGIANIIRDWLREYDVAARFGGEEFSVLMPETSAAEAAGLVEELRRRIETQSFPIPSRAEPLRATVSFGVAERTERDLRIESLIHRADVALYRAKVDGRNLVRVASAHELETPPPNPHPSRRRQRPIEVSSP